MSCRQHQQWHLHSGRRRDGQQRDRNLVGTNPAGTVSIRTRMRAFRRSQARVQRYRRPNVSDRNLVSGGAINGVSLSKAAQRTTSCRGITSGRTFRRCPFAQRRGRSDHRRIIEQHRHGQRHFGAIVTFGVLFVIGGARMWPPANSIKRNKIGTNAPALRLWRMDPMACFSPTPRAGNTIGGATAADGNTIALTTTRRVYIARRRKQPDRL